MALIAGDRSTVDAIVPQKIRGHVRTAAQLAEARQGLGGATGRGCITVPWAPLPALERGRVYACTGDASLSLLYALVAEATRQGAWFAMVDMPHAGLMAAREHGVALHRTLCVDTGPRDGASTRWSRVVGALVDGVDLVAVSPPSCSSSEMRRLIARTKASGAVLLVLGRAGVFDVDAEFRTRTLSWRFDLHARSRSVEVAVEGRRAHGTPPCVVELPVASGTS